MIWLNHTGPVRPSGAQVSTAVTGGRSYDVWFGRQARNTICYPMAAGTTSVRDLDTGQFAAGALRRGYIRRSWFLIGAEAGLELRQGGAGLATDSLAVNVPGDRPAPAAAGPAATRPAPGSAPAAAGVSRTVRYPVAHAWPGGLQAQPAPASTGTSPISGWTPTWPFAGGQRATDRRPPASPPAAPGATRRPRYRHQHRLRVHPAVQARRPCSRVRGRLRNLARYDKISAKRSGDPAPATPAGTALGVVSAMLASLWQGPAP